jgi:DNA-binding beta-propeller fold protein YncE
VDYRNSRLIKLDASGEIKFNIGGKGNATGKFDAPWGVAVDAQGNVLVADTFNHRIQRLDKDGNFLGMWGVPGVTIAPGNGKTTQFFGPRDIAFDRNGKVLVVDTGNKRVQVFEPDGTYLTQFGSEGGEAGLFREPVGLEIDAGGNIYVADMWNKRIQVFDPAYKFVRQFPVEEWAAMPQNELQAVDNKAYMASTARALFVSSPKQRKVLVFGLDGRKLDVDLGLPNNLAPVGLAVRGNKLVISDANGGGVQEFDLPASVQ